MAQAWPKLGIAVAQATEVSAGTLGLQVLERMGYRGSATEVGATRRKKNHLKLPSCLPYAPALEQTTIQRDQAHYASIQRGAMSPTKGIV